MEYFCCVAGISRCMLVLGCFSKEGAGACLRGSCQCVYVCYVQDCYSTLLGGKAQGAAAKEETVH